MRLEVRDVSCGYRPGKPVIRNVTFDLESGDVCTLLGPNGVGKTTLFKTILNQLKPLAGQICIDGSDITQWNMKKRSRYIAYVAQAHVPSFPYQVRDIAMLGRMGQTAAMGRPTLQDYEVVSQALETVGIRHLEEAVYTEISGGERQLLMIARALAQEPRILLMDEPTANLDYGNMLLVMSTIRRLADRGLCVLFTTHMPDQAFMCRAKVAMLFRNDPLLFGDADRIITKDSLYRAYGADVDILEVMNAAGRAVRMCAPGMMIKELEEETKHGENN